MAEAQEPQEGQQEERPRSKLPFIIIGFVILLAVIGVISYSMLSKKTGDVPSGPTPKPIGYMFTFPDQFTNNLAPPDDQLMVTVSITLEISYKTGSSLDEAKKEIGIETDPTNKNILLPKIKQIINEVFQTKSSAEVNNPAGKERIKAQIKNQLNTLLKQGRVDDVILESFIIS
ncbi:MAG: flagellar basal body-associated FliL family protein [Candidatus Omnitrophota bacterium]